MVVMPSHLSSQHIDIVASFDAIWLLVASPLTVMRDISRRFGIQQLECPPRQGHRLTDVAYRCQGSHVFKVLYLKNLESSAIFLRARILQRKPRARCVTDAISEHYIHEEHHSRQTQTFLGLQMSCFQSFVSACRVRVTICHDCRNGTSISKKTYRKSSDRKGKEEDLCVIFLQEE